jgi:hypothetical protein
MKNDGMEGLCQPLPNPGGSHQGRRVGTLLLFPKLHFVDRSVS